jgi:hypothetical protein
VIGTAVLTTPRGTRHARRHAALAAACAVLLAAAGAHAQVENYIWLTTDPNNSGFGSVTNPTPGLQLGADRPLYIWVKRNLAPLGFDAISLNVEVHSSDGGQVSASLSFDNPGGTRWTGIGSGAALAGTGGTGIANANAIDLTNTDTIGDTIFRLGTLTITGEQLGTVDLYLGIGDKGIADDGIARIFNIGFAQGSTIPEAQNIISSNFGAISTVPEATITVIPGIFGDFDDDGDVDLADYGHFLACYNGPAQPYGSSGCENADADGDNDVDLSDYGTFLFCYNGPNRPPACGGG